MNNKWQSSASICHLVFVPSITKHCLQLIFLEHNKLFKQLVQNYAIVHSKYFCTGALKGKLDYHNYNHKIELELNLDSVIDHKFKQDLFFLIKASNLNWSWRLLNDQGFRFQLKSSCLLLIKSQSKSIINTLIIT